jgi:hypothetical protein
LTSCGRMAFLRELSTLAWIRSSCCTRQQNNIYNNQ